VIGKRGKPIGNITQKPGLKLSQFTVALMCPRFGMKVMESWPSLEVWGGSDRLLKGRVGSPDEARGGGGGTEGDIGRARGLGTRHGLPSGGQHGWNEKSTSGEDGKKTQEIRMITW